MSSHRFRSYNEEEPVERFRRKNRQVERGYRDQERDLIDNTRGRRPRPREIEDESNRKRKKIALERDREKRMARLRQELRNEDEHLASLDKKKGETYANEEPSDNQSDDISSSSLKPQESIIKVNPEELNGMDEEEQMLKLLGIEGFGSTKGETVQDNYSTAARGVAAKTKRRRYRQYMNRKNGFNRPLDKMN